MNNDHGGIFREIDPPAGGAERFRQRLEAAGESPALRLRPVLAAGVAAAALVVAALVALQQADVAPQQADVAEREVAAPSVAAEAPVVNVVDASAFARLLGRPLEPVATTVAIDDMPVTLTEIPGTRPGIRIYEVRAN